MKVDRMKIQLSITDNEKAILELKAEAMGMTIAKFIHFLIYRESYNILSKPDIATTIKKIRAQIQLQKESDNDEG